MNGASDGDRRKDIAALRDHLYRHGPCTMAEAARATGLRFAQISAMLHEGSLSHVGATPATARCSICRGQADVGDLCRRCRQDLQRSARSDPGSAERPASGRGGGMRSRR